MATTIVTVPPPVASIELESRPLTAGLRVPPINTQSHTISAGDEESSPLEDRPPEGATVFERPNVSTVKGMLLSTNFAVFLAGMNDGSTGALIPYLQPAYDIGLLFVAVVYLINFSGWLVAAFTNVHLTARLGMGGVLTVGAAFQFTAYCLMFWKPPYPLFVFSFFLLGIGLAYQDSQANVFVANVNNSHRWLGILHALYGAGALFGPLIATTIAARTAHWHCFYLVTLGLAVVNLGLLVWTFQDGLFKGTAAAKESASQDLKKALSQRTVIVLSLFFFLYVGTEVTAGGWVVEFLIRVRNGDPSKVGYVASGFWGGLTLGRLVLADISHKLGERRMVFAYIILALVAQLIFTLVPNIIANAVMISLLGFFLGPLFPTGISVATKVLPRELHIASIGFAATMGQAGSAAFPFLTGAIAAKSGVKVLQPMLIGLLAGMAIFWAFIPRVARHSS
ncbi:major facilitator superfamily domain-containing protein [Tuber borchii]|uniref:Major facilitator superfamily domain-containing protein n=1 Tax=Tuber borchii TaxID=42251 RepID=A0A2T6ZQ07_TUBBO|nr:major facilitator superfamily domain-containing protein [Tuber borchii]